MAGELDVRRRRAAYRAAHRGTKEMDVLLTRFAEARLEAMSDAELTEFEDLLAAPDPELQVWILDVRTIPEARYAAQIEQLRRFHDLLPAGS